MESILESMLDHTLTEEIHEGIKTTSLYDLSPVFEPRHDVISLDISKNINQFSLSSELYSSVFKETNDIDHVYDQVCDILNKYSYRDTFDSNTRERLEIALKLIEKYSLTGFIHYSRGLVYFPDLLERFFDVHRIKGITISEDNLGAMICRCIERKSSAKESYSQNSLNSLITFKGDISLEIKLLPGKYIIDDDLYELAKRHNIRDSYYDNIMKIDFITNENEDLYTNIRKRYYNAIADMKKYSHMDVVMKENKGLYTGFRDAYHCLLYGGNDHLQALIVKWDLWGDDCTADAAREYFHVDEEASSLCSLKREVNNETDLRKIIVKLSKQIKVQ
jgi:hypothetical protein